MNSIKVWNLFPAERTEVPCLSNLKVSWRTFNLGVYYPASIIRQLKKERKCEGEILIEIRKSLIFDIFSLLVYSLNQWISNFLVTGLLYILEHYYGPQRAFVYMGYSY